MMTAGPHRRVLPWIVCLAPVLWPGAKFTVGASEQEVYVIVREAGSENRRGRRVYGDKLYLVPSEKPSAVLDRNTRREAICHSGG